MKKDVCLITGGAGFIGLAISKLLVNEFKRVVVFDNMHPQIHKNSNRPSEMDSRVELVIGDVTIDEDWDNLLKNITPDLIVHLAAETGTGQSLTESSRHANVNVLGTTKMLDALIRWNKLPEKIILTSSRAIYGEGLWMDSEGREFYPGQRTDKQLSEEKWDFEGARSLPISCEKNVPMPCNIYAATKLAQENIISAWSKSYNVNYTIVRLQNVYGPGQSLINSYTGIVSLFVRIAKRNKSIPLYEDGEMLRDFILIDDVATAICAVIDSGNETNGEVYDIGSGYSATIKEVSEIIANHYNAPKPHICKKYRNGDVRHASCDIDKTLKALNWKPKYTLEEGLSRLCDWIDYQQKSEE